MQVEWTSYNSPIGTLTVVECEAGPLAVEFPHRAMTIKWAVRLRAAVPELHIAQGTCRITTTWLDEYFGGSSRPFPFPDYLKRWFDLSPAQVAERLGIKRNAVDQAAHRGHRGHRKVAEKLRAA